MHGKHCVFIHNVQCTFSCVLHRECPLALEAMTGLMSLGVKGPDVAALVMNGAPNTSDWSVPRIILRTIFSYWDIQINPKEFVLHALNFFITYYKLLEDREQKIEKHFLYNF